MAIKHLIGAFETEGFKTPTQRLLWLEACYNADRRGVVRVSAVEMAHACLISHRSALRVIQELEKMDRVVRVGHGRYAVRFPGRSEEDDERELDPTLPRKGQHGYQGTKAHQRRVDEELERLQKIRVPGQAIAWEDTEDGLWPSLRDISKIYNR